MNEIFTHLIVSNDHPCLTGHFPGRPIVPGVLLLDLALDAMLRSIKPALRLEAIVSAKFLQAVAPDQRVDLKITFSPENDGGRVKARFTASRESVTVLEGSFFLAPNSAGGSA
jgi:3-hydroxymyristoyl/3-hydroxydecanoyl-(acyl carrier protein) dehydratase